MESNLEEQLDLFVVDFPVNHFQSQVNDEEMKTIVTSGLRCCELFEKSDLLGCLVKTLVTSPTWTAGTTGRTLIWRRRDTKFGHLRYQLLVSVRPTSGKDSGSSVIWPTPRVVDTEGGVAKNVELKDGSFSRTNAKGVRWGVKLRCAVESQVWPTPTVSDHRGSGPTVIRKDGKDRRKERLDYATEQETPTTTGKLNPTWVEWLMGFPTGWTELNVSETP